MPESERIEISREQIRNMEKIDRLKLINSTPGYKSVNLIGTTDPSGNFNLAIFSSVIHLGSNPPLLGMISRPITVERHSFDNIIETGVYTINHVHTEIIDSAHQTSAKYSRETSEFKATGLTPVLMHGFKAPFVEESSIRIAMSLVERQEIRSNGTHLLVGEIQFISAPKNIVREDGSFDLSAAGTVAMSGVDTYLACRELSRKGYARIRKG